jgi:hypothetical protein
VPDRLDEDRIETLRRWGAGLADDDRDELRAAGKAILMLIEEIERLQVDIWHARDSAVAADTVSAGIGGAAAAEDEAEALPTLPATLRERLRALLPSHAPKDPSA